jgi:inosine-uridine nucleoside N-ribohydrolase
VDVDTSDTNAFLYLLKHPFISVQAITVSCGVTFIDAGVENPLRVLDYSGVS